MSDYEIRPGDTLSKIAKKYGVTVKQLQEANGIKNPNLIFAGKNLKIPIEQDDAFDIPGLKIDKDNQTPVRTLYGVPTPSGTTPTVPSGEVRTLYAHITPKEPSGVDIPKITPSDGAKKIPLYGIVTPSEPSGSEVKPKTPTVPSGEVRTLYAHITPKEPSGVELPKITPTGGGKMVPLYGIVTPSGADTIVTPKPSSPVKVPTPAKTKPLTDAEKKAADTMGKNVAHYLAGYTMDVEQEAIVNNVNKVNNRNVLEFLRVIQITETTRLCTQKPSLRKP